MYKKIKLPYFEGGPAEAIDQFSRQIIGWMERSNSLGGVIGLSGGLDSSTVAYLCKHAFDNHKKKDYSLLGVIMKSKANSYDDYAFAKDVQTQLGIKCIEIDIEPIVRGFKRSIDKYIIADKYDLGNLYSEIRAVLLSRIAAKNNLLIMGTGNKDEDYVLGYFTKRGDGAVDNNILGDLSKRLVRELARFLTVSVGIVNREPTAGQWKGQTDKNDLGYDYNTAEAVFCGVQQKLDLSDTMRQTGCDQQTLFDIIKRHNKTRHKRKSIPIGMVALIDK